MLGGAGEPAQVGEEHRAFHLDAAEAEVGVGSLQHLVDDGLGHEPREDVAHLLAFEGDEDVVHPERADRRERERGERVDEQDDPAVIERQLHGDREQPCGQHGRRQRDPGRLLLAIAGARKPSTRISAIDNGSGSLRRGRPRRTVAIEFACTSAPGISGSVGVSWMSWSEGAVGPITTILSLKVPFGMRPLRTRE